MEVKPDKLSPTDSATVECRYDPMYHITYGTVMTATERKSDFKLTTDTPYPIEMEVQDRCTSASCRHLGWRHFRFRNFLRTGSGNDVIQNEEITSSGSGISAILHLTPQWDKKRPILIAL